MIARDILVAYADTLLDIDNFSDYSPNGLQIAGGATVTKIATAVTASQQAIALASQWQADVLVVHHGYFWQNEPRPIVGAHHARIAALIQNNISLLGYHLPLDQHAKLGNNAQLARLLGLEITALLPTPLYGVATLLPQPQSAQQFAVLVSQQLGNNTVILGDDSKSIQKIAVCTGGAQNQFASIITLGFDAYICGEASEQQYHQALESNTCFIWAGHHATERYGVQALGSHLAAHFGIEHRYFELDNPV